MSADRTCSRVAAVQACSSHNPERSQAAFRVGQRAGLHRSQSQARAIRTHWRAQDACNRWCHYVQSRINSGGETHALAGDGAPCASLRPWVLNMRLRCKEPISDRWFQPSSRCKTVPKYCSAVALVRRYLTVHVPCKEGRVGPKCDSFGVS